MGSNEFSRRSWERFSQPLPSLEARLAISVFLCLCLFVVTGLETLSHREHEARAHWHSFHFFHCFSLSLSFPDWFHLGGRVGPWWEGQQSSLNLTHDLTLSRGRLGKDLSAMAWTFGLPLHVLCLSVVAGLEELSRKECESGALWNCFRFCGCLSLSHWFHLAGRVGSLGEVRQCSLILVLLWAGVGRKRFPRLWSYFWPLFTCVCLLLPGRASWPISIMKLELFDIVLTFLDVFHYLMLISFGRVGSWGEDPLASPSSYFE